MIRSTGVRSYFPSRSVSSALLYSSINRFLTVSQVSFFTRRLVLWKNPLFAWLRDEASIWATSNIFPEYDEHTAFWGLSYQGKNILDIGADWGSTAEYFLKNDAKHVYAVEGNRGLFAKLQHRVSRKLTPIFLYVTSSKQVERLITLCKPDMVKMDIEGGEDVLLAVKNLRDVREWLVEVHYPGLSEKLKQLFTHASFHVDLVRNPGSTWELYAKNQREMPRN